MWRKNVFFVVLFFLILTPFLPKQTDISAKMRTVEAVFEQPKNYLPKNEFNKNQKSGDSESGKFDQNWLPKVQKQLEDEEYFITYQDKATTLDIGPSYQAPNRANNFRIYFLKEGIKVIPRLEKKPYWELGLSLMHKDKNDIQSSIKGNRIEYQHGWVKEWYVNSKDGLENGFTIFNPNSSEKNSLLQIDIKLSGNLRPVFSEDGQAVDFFSNGNVSILRYSQLKAINASNAVLNARFQPIVGGIRILIEDKNAIYPITIDSLLTTPAWIAEGNQTNASFGIATSPAGDVNGDGYSDVLVSARYYDNGETDEGRVYLFLGSPSGLSFFPSWIAEGNQAGAEFGSSISTAGDINGDGYSDVLVGAYLYDNLEVDEGRAYLYLGSSLGLSETPSWTAESDQNYAMLGCSVSTAGDVNGDGYSDVIIGALNYDNGQTNEGCAYLYLGSQSGLSHRPVWTYESNKDDTFFGNSVSTAGDVNGDGYGDVIIGGWGYDNGANNEGAAFLFLGSPAGLSETPNWIAEGELSNATFGSMVSTAGDVNGDGYSDVIIGAPRFSFNFFDEGRAYIYFGSSSGLSLTPSWSLDGNQDDTYFGWSVFSAGDINGDGYSDILVGAVSYDGGLVNEGKAYLFLGSPSGPSTSPSWSVSGNQEQAQLGFYLSTAGDVNGDGYSDVIIGAPYYDNGEINEGRAFLFLGSSSGLSTTPVWSMYGSQANSRMGYSVSTAGDVNGDGYSDVIVGAPYYDNGETDEGRAFLYQGSSSGLSTSYSWYAEINSPNAQFGCSVSSAGDVNGDGYSDVIVGARSYLGSGGAFLFLGSTSGLSSVPSWYVYSTDPDSSFGWSVSTAGDINGDGFSDVIIGDPFYKYDLENVGRVIVYLGSPTGLDFAPSWYLIGDLISSYVGYSVSTAGDVNGDGYSDILIGDIGAYYNGFWGSGRVYLFTGSPNGLSSTASWTYDGPQGDAHLGYSVSTAGDVNGDGYSDVLVGAPHYDNGQIDEGIVYCFLGSYTGLGNLPYWSAEGNQESANFGFTVSTAGDVNGDGYSDVLIGAPYYDNGELNEGRGFLYLGSNAGLLMSESWTIESNQTGASLGISLSTAGDVNGDGYSDALVGACYFDYNQNEEGKVYLFYGNENNCAKVLPKQQRTSFSNLIVPPLFSDSSNSFGLQFFNKSDFGRIIGKAQIEIKKYGEMFDSTFTESEWTDLGRNGYEFNRLIDGLDSYTLYKWRVRVKYHPKYGYPIHSRWIYNVACALNEAHLRTNLNPDLDQDSDGVVNSLDCSPLNISVWSAPQTAVSDLMLSGQQGEITTLRWSEPLNVGTNSPWYDVLRSENPSSFENAFCLNSNISQVTAYDQEIPTSIFYYLIRVENSCGSNMGTNSQGIPRTGIQCP